MVTNVPGPPVPIYSAGARLESMMGLICLTDGMGLAHTVQSYHKEATITFTADRDMMPDPEFYAQCIRDSFAELRDAALGGGAKPAAKPAAAGKAPAKKAPAKKPAAKKAATGKPAAKKRAAPKRTPAEPVKGSVDKPTRRAKPKPAKPLKGPTKE